MASNPDNLPLRGLRTNVKSKIYVWHAKRTILQNIVPIFLRFINILSMVIPLLKPHFWQIPFPLNTNKCVTQNLGPWHKRNLGHPSQGGASSNANILMLSSTMGLSTQVNNYDVTEVNLMKCPSSTSQSNGPLVVKKSALDPSTCLLKVCFISSLIIWILGMHNTTIFSKI